MFNTIVLNFGYVEDSCPFNWVFTCKDGFSTRYEAAQSLAMDLFEAWRDSYDYQNSHPAQNIKDCCLKFKEDAENKWCAKCGTNLKPKEELLYEEFEEWLRNNHGSNYDDWDGTSYFGNGEGHWDANTEAIFGLIEEKTVIIRCAEKILPIALYGKGLGKDYDNGVIKKLHKTLDIFIQSIEDNEASICIG